MQALQNFNDIYQSYQNQNKTEPRTVRSNNKPKPVSNPIDVGWMIGNDLLKCARRRNNILTKEIYQAEGSYTLNDVRKFFGSFNKACVRLRIVNPDNIEDYDMVVANIKDVFTHERKIDAAIYREYGAYPYQAIEQRYGFNRICVREGLMEPDILYPSYPRKSFGRSLALRWVGQCRKIRGY